MNKALVPSAKDFPALSGVIEEDTGTIISELRVGRLVVETGLARLYLIWKSKEYLQATYPSRSCSACGLEASSGDKACISCGGIIEEEYKPIYPTLESYIEHLSIESGKSRQTLFNRLRAYRVLCDERGVDARLVFSLNVFSSGAASKLASADEDDPNLDLADGSWEKTVQTALMFETKADALSYVKYDVLHEPRIFSEEKGDKITVYKERMDGGDLVVNEYSLRIGSGWTPEMLDWLRRQLRVHQ